MTLLSHNSSIRGKVWVKQWDKYYTQIVYQYFGTHNSAWSTRCYEFAKRWVKAGHKVTVLTSPYDKSDITKNSADIESNTSSITSLTSSLDSKTASLTARLSNEEQRAKDAEKSLETKINSNTDIIL
jgi:hypothetical protein